MKSLLNEYFHISAHGKISEKNIILRFATAITVIIFCLIAMGTTAFAYFSHDITSQKNIIKSAHFEALIQITSSDGEQIAVNSDNRTAPYADIKADTTYYVTLKHSEHSTAKTGFVIISADKCQSRFHTQQLGRDVKGNTETFTFTITPNNDTRVTFLSHWGTSSYYGYKNTDNPLYITEKNKDIELSVTLPLMLKPVESTVPETTVKSPEQTSPQKPANTAPPATEITKPVEITVPETTGSPDTQIPTTPSTETTTPETTSTETVIKTPETTISEPAILETTAQVTTIPETNAPATTFSETSAPELTRETQAETNPPDSPETLGISTKEASK